MSDTPETDASLVYGGYPPSPWIPVEHARTLERQRDEANREAAHHKLTADFLEACERSAKKEAFEARAEAQRLREAILRILPGMKAQRPPALGAWNWPHAVKELEEALEGPTVATTDTSRRIMTAHGKEWWVHIPGDPMPCDGELRVYVMLRGWGWDGKSADDAGELLWKKFPSPFEHSEIIAWRPADAPDKLPREGGEG